MRHPLEAPPRDSEALGIFLRHFRLERRGPEASSLPCIVRAFARIPYENLTKIIKYDACRDPRTARRFPLEVVRDHEAWGAGGTCFSLTATLLHLLRASGFEAEPILADRPYGANTHCALLVRGENGYALLDPGYLILRPIPLETLLRPASLTASRSPETIVATDFNDLVLVPHPSGEKLDLHTVQDGKRVHRITFKLRPADPGEFLAAWDASFEWDTMRSPVLTRVVDSRQLYLHETRLQVRERLGASRTKLPLDALPGAVAETFGVAPGVVRQAIEVLVRKGEVRPEPAPGGLP